jgi:signal transduction histidine kinase
VDLGELVRSHEPAWADLAGAFGAELSVETTRALVSGDPLRLAQVCSNLIANAAEHGEGTVRVSVRERGGRACVEVADDGPGLPASVAVLTRPRSGRRGHGLAIAGAIAEQHGGRLTAAPSAGGARLVLDLPAAPRPRQAARR